jgi:hypothetical protein
MIVMRRSSKRRRTKISRRRRQLEKDENERISRGGKGRN